MFNHAPTIENNLQAIDELNAVVITLSGINELLLNMTDKADFNGDCRYVIANLAEYCAYCVDAASDKLSEGVTSE